MVGEAHLKEECLRQVWSRVERLVSCVSKRTVPLILSHLHKWLKTFYKTAQVTGQAKHKASSKGEKRLPRVHGA